MARDMVCLVVDNMVVTGLITVAAALSYGELAE
jgi:hypothetical protein